MKKKQLFLQVALTLLCTASLALPSYAMGVMFDIDYPEITSPHAILVDANYDEILFTQGAYDRAYPASTTKIMTGLLVAKAVEEGRLSMDTMVTATEEHTVDLSIYGSSQGISAGEEMSVGDLLYCLLLASANEAGNILAIEVAGSIEEFVLMMNEMAAELGCIGTQYRNTHGLHDDEHYTTAYDLYLIMKKAMSYDVFAEVVGTSTYTTSATNQQPERLFYNSNGLLSEWYYKGYSYEYCIGGKTGSTPEAGRCLVSAAEMGNEYVIAVVLGAQPVILEDGSTLLPQMSESRSLLKFGIEVFDRRSVVPGNDPVGQIVVSLSDENDAVLVKATGEIEKTLPISMDLSLIETEVTIDVESLEAPVQQGQVVGSMSLSYQGEVYGVLDVVTMHDVTRSEILYQKQQMESFFGDWGIYMAGGALVAVGAVAGVQVTMKKRRRANSWRNNQRRNTRRSNHRGTRR